jgi:hypothetical protein
MLERAIQHAIKALKEDRPEDASAFLITAENMLPGGWLRQQIHQALVIADLACVGHTIDIPDAIAALEALLEDPR